ncbi:hypothetical protein [Rhizobium leguminosarum]|uniref:hypothetical protein n=1 Tax=Rhizobium leguminosarum TaxID=384 RepID=UPI001C986FEA|nr:hypothetical protein [Rhizobium leguminosarum]
MEWLVGRDAGYDHQRIHYPANIQEALRRATESRNSSVLSSTSAYAEARACADAFRKGQEAMRDRAASLIAHPQCHFAEPHEAADAIRALLIEEPK